MRTIKWGSAAAVERNRIGIFRGWLERRPKGYGIFIAQIISIQNAIDALQWLIKMFPSAYKFILFIAVHAQTQCTRVSANCEVMRHFCGSQHFAYDPSAAYPSWSPGRNPHALRTSCGLITSTQEPKLQLESCLSISKLNIFNWRVIV